MFRIPHHMFSIIKDTENLPTAVKTKDKRIFKRIPRLAGESIYLFSQCVEEDFRHMYDV